MPTVSLQLKEKNNQDKNVITTIQYINPQAQDRVMLEFAYHLSSLTNSKYVGTTKIEKTNLDLEDFERGGNN